MARIIRVSRHGLTRCPACQAHIQIAADVRETACPFCQAALIATPETVGGKLGGLIQGALATGRSGLLAASLLGLSVGAGACSEEEDPEPTTDTQSADGTSGTSDGTGNTDTQVVTGEDATVQPLYGEPSDAFTVEDSEDSGPVDLYGLPPDAITASDAPQEDTTDTPVAAYGIPPDASSP